jgi:hypothetical protein
VATNRRQPQGIAMCGSSRLHRLQSAKQDTRSVALELSGTRSSNIDSQAVPTQCDPYSLYVQLSRCRSLDGIMLISKAREREFIGNKVPENMVAVEERLELLSEATIREAESRDWTET